MPAPNRTDPGPAAVRRSPVRRLLETRGVIGNHRHPHVRVGLTTQDDVNLVASFLPGPDPTAPTVVLAHGFAGHRRKPSYAMFADHLATTANVLALDLRGHGQSAGLCTLGDREALDVDAAVAWLRRRGHRQVVLVGASMGGTSILHAVARGTAVEAAVAISTPAMLREHPDTAPMQRLKRHWESPVSRAGMRWGMGVRLIDPTAWRSPGHPRDFAATATMPLLVVHAPDDGYFPVSDAEAIAGAAPRGTLWLEPHGFGHAEDGFTPAFAHRLAGAVTAALDAGAFPDPTR